MHRSFDPLNDGENEEEVALNDSEIKRINTALSELRIPASNKSHTYTNKPVIVWPLQVY